MILLGNVGQDTKIHILKNVLIYDIYSMHAQYVFLISDLNLLYFLKQSVWAPPKYQI